jgi:hypothetical protein
MRASLKKDKAGFFTCGWCNDKFKPSPKAVLDYTVPDLEGVYAVFCSNDCAEKFTVAEAEADTEAQSYEPEIDETGRVLI